MNAGTETAEATPQTGRADAANAPHHAPDPAAQRAQLMADPQWRAQAVTGKGDAWAELQRLDAAILQGGGSTDQKAQPGADDGEAGFPAGFFDPPADPTAYDLPITYGRTAGLELEPAVEQGLRRGLHEAGVDNGLAQALYFAVARGALHPPADPEAEHEQSAEALRQQWGADFEANLQAANDEARAIFHFLPASVTGGLSFSEYVREVGLGNSRLAIEQLYLRAKQRKSRGR